MAPLMALLNMSGKILVLLTDTDTDAVTEGTAGHSRSHHFYAFALVGFEERHPVTHGSERRIDASSHEIQIEILLV